MTDKELIKAELQNLQKILEAKADMCIGNGKVRLLSLANTCSDALELLKEQEPVRYGWWEPSPIPCEKYVCSCCGGACWYYDYEGNVAKSNYCPNCGAKMSVGDKDMIYEDYLRMRAISENDALAITDWIEKKRKETQRLCDALKPEPPKEVD